MTFSRRDVMIGAGALAAAPLAAAPQGADAQAASSGPAGRALSALFDTLVQERLRHGPESATIYGLDVGPNADLRSRLSDYSLAGLADDRRRNADQIRRLSAIDRSGLTAAEQVNYDTIFYTRRSAARFDAFAYGSGGSSPYVISQQDGAYQDVPDFMDTKHPVANAPDADAYLARMEAFATALDQDTEHFAHDVGLGVIPPDFILDKALTQMRALAVPAEQAGMVASITRRAAAAGLADHYGTDAARLWRERITPALQRQIDRTTAARARAGHAAGVGRLPRGQAFYAAALHAQTTTDLSPAEVHRIGREQAAQITARLDALLRAQGLTQGTVGARIRGLYADPASFFPNTDAGKQQLIGFCNERQAAIMTRLPRAFRRLPTYRFEVRRVPPSIEAGAASAYSQSPSLDGTRPGIVYFNLADSAEWPRWALPTTIYHEGLPGHQLEGGLALSNADLPLIRKMTGFAAYAEGWALYAEQLADELGIYEDDPMGRIGWLRFQLFRALRCVADTGLHHLGWSYERAIALFTQGEGDAPGFATREVERYVVNPGQACAYKIGHTVWVRARQRAIDALGPRYDIKDFHDAGLGAGRCPLQVLDSVVDRYIAARRAT